MDYTILTNEITTDPLNLGYSALLGHNDSGIADILNAVTGAGAATVTLGTQTKGAVLLGIIPALDQLAAGKSLSNTALDSTVSQKWMNRFNAMRSGQNVLVVDSLFLGLLAELVTDGLFTQANLDAITKKTGSRAEVLFGSGTIVSWADVAKAQGR